MNISTLICKHRVQLGRKPDPFKTGRMSEARRLSDLMRQSGGFSFARLGDYDIGLLLKPEEASAEYNASHQKISGTQAGGSPGLLPDQVPRLRTALENSSFLDFHELLWLDGSLIKQLNLCRRKEKLQNSSRECSYILPTWLEFEFKDFCRGRRILFCGAEAPLLENLAKQAMFLKNAKPFWPDLCEIFYLRPRSDGRNLAANLDGIKADLRETILKNKINTLFLSLGGGAKILCCELAEELGIVAIDFGVGLRALTYSGSDGNAAVRSTHFVYLYRVPFGHYMSALTASYPELSPEMTFAKAHAQLLLEVQEKEVGWSHSAWEFDFSEENRNTFEKGFKEYKIRFQHLFNYSAATKLERKHFLHFCGMNDLTGEGKRFMSWFKFKSWLRSRI